MHWNDKAIILSVKRLGESAAIIHLITPTHGLHAGVDRGAMAKRKRGIYQPGNIVNANWKARLAEQMGTLSCELTESLAAHILDDRRKLAALASAAQMTEKVLHDRDAQPAVYAHMESFVRALREDGDWLLAYVLLEFALLEHAGFGLDLSRCAATGKAHDLVYVSPKSGRAVSREAGRPYHERMFSLPGFLMAIKPLNPLSLQGEGQGEGLSCGWNPFHNPPPEGGGDPGNVQKTGIPITHILDGVRLCGHFLHERVFTPRGAVLPHARGRFVEMLMQG